MSIAESIKKEFNDKYDIDLGEYHQFRKTYEFKGNIKGYHQTITLFIGIGMNTLSVSLSSSPKILVEPFSKSLSEINEENLVQVCQLAHLCALSLDKRANALTEEFDELK